MDRSHFPVFDWEPGDPVDEEHLAECTECRGLWETRQLLELEARSAPEPEEAPFFAARVARLAVAETASIWVSFEQVARRLIPVFASLTLLVLLSTYFFAPSPPAEEFAELLFEPEPREELTLDDVLFSLSLQLEEEGFGEDQ